MQFVFDLDGTLCFDGVGLAPDIRRLLEKADQYGHRVVLASARSYRDCIGLLGEQLAQNLVIGLNGGLAYDKGQLVFHRHLEDKAFRLALSWCHTYNFPYFVDNDFNYSSYQMEKMPFARHVDPLGLAERVSLAELRNPIKMVINMGQHQELVEDFRHHLQLLDCMDIYYDDHEKCLYLNPYETNKATTIVDLIGPNFVAFGNDQNDRDMFKESLYSIQVGSYKPLTEYSDELIPADSQAISKKIEELFERFA